jgi:hypothetical protein
MVAEYQAAEDAEEEEEEEEEVIERDREESVSAAK